MKSKELKRAEAEARQAAHNALTPAQRYEKTAYRPGASSRERVRLLDDLALDEFD